MGPTQGLLTQATKAKPPKGGDAKLKGLKWQPATERGINMKKSCRLTSVLLVLLFLISLLFPATALAADSCFDFSGASDGYVIVFYVSASDKPLKVGISNDAISSVIYYDYFSSSRTGYTLPQGAADVTVSLFENVSGDSYRKLKSQTVNLFAMQGGSISQDQYASQIPVGSNENIAVEQAVVKNLPASAMQYLGSVSEISFRANDSVSKKAAELIKGKSSTQAKAMAIYSYIVKNFSYNWDLYYDVIYGRVTRYTPDPNSILRAKKGICYDIASLYAAMMRSVGIPTKLVKGNCKPAGGYHAWNSVYDEASGNWVDMDLTLDMANRKGKASKWRRIGKGYSQESAS